MSKRLEAGGERPAARGFRGRALAASIILLTLQTDQVVQQTLSTPPIPLEQKTNTPEARIDSLIAESDKAMEEFEAAAKNFGDFMPSEARDRMKLVFDFYKHNKTANPWRNLYTLRKVYEESNGKMYGRPALVGDFYFEELDSPSPDVDARYEITRQSIILPKGYKLDAFFRSLAIFHEVDHALSWAERSAKTSMPASNFAGRFILTEEAGRYALNLEILNGMMQGRLKTAAKNDVLDTSTRFDLAKTLELTPNSPAIDVLLDLSKRYFNGGGNLGFYPNAFMLWLCKTYREQEEEYGKTLSPYIEQNAADGKLIPYQCANN